MVRLEADAQQVSCRAHRVVVVALVRESVGGDRVLEGFAGGGALLMSQEETAGFADQ
jgi:hypothetical protein